MQKFILGCFFLFVISASALAQTGKKVELNSIKFKGNLNFSDSKLKLVIYSQETPMWIWKFLNSFTGFGREAAYFDSSLIKIDIQALSEFYMTNGFFDSKVAYSYTIDTSAAAADLVYEITEGKPSNFGNVNLSGLISIPGHTYKNILDNFSIDSTKRFSQNLVQENIDKIVTNLQNNGYMNASFDSTIVYKDTMKLKADMSVYFSPGNLYSIDDIMIKTKGEGAPYVEDTLIVQLTDIKRGDLYSQEKIRRSQVRLFRTGMFNSISVTGIKSDSLTSLIPIEVNGSIGKMNELSPEVIVNNQNSEFNMGLGASYTRKNFLGRARRFTATGSFGIQDLFQINLDNLFNNFSMYDNTNFGYADARIKVEQPFLFNEPIVGILEAYYTISKSSAYNVLKYGGKLSFEFEMPQYTFLNSLSSYYNLEINNQYSRVIVDEIKNEDGSVTEIDSLVRKPSNLSIIGVDLKSLKSNDPVFPSGGNNTTLLIEEANFLSYLTAKLAKREYAGAMFYKLLGSTAFYFPVTSIKNSVWGLKLKSGFIHAYRGSIDDIPSDKKFFVGGASSLRGWSQRDQEINPIAENSTADDPGSGGTFMFEGSAEFRLKFLSDLGSTLFIDWGRSWREYKDFRFSDIAINIGFGFKYYTSFAPFRIDIGIKTYNPSSPVDKSKWLFDKSFNSSFWDAFTFQFGIGEAF